MANLLQFVPERGCRFEILVRNGFLQFLLQPFKLLGQILALLEHLRNLSDVFGSFMHRFEQTLESFSKSVITLGASQSASFLEVSLREAAVRTLEFSAARLLHF